MNRSDDFEGWDDEDEEDDEEDYDDFLDDFYSGNLPTRQPQNVNRSSSSCISSRTCSPASSSAGWQLSSITPNIKQTERALLDYPRGGVLPRGPPTSSTKSSTSGPARTSSGPSHPPQQNRPSEGPARTSPGPLSSSSTKSSAAGQHVLHLVKPLPFGNPHQVEALMLLVIHKTRLQINRLDRHLMPHNPTCITCP